MSAGFTREARGHTYHGFAWGVDVTTCLKRRKLKKPLLRPRCHIGGFYVVRRRLIVRTTLRIAHWRAAV